MLLRQEVVAGVEVLCVHGPVAPADAPVLRAAVADAAARGPRGVLVDLAAAGRLPAPAVDVLSRAVAEAGDWPRPAVVCCGPQPVPGLALHLDCAAALAHVDDRTALRDRVRATLTPGPQGPGEARRLAADCAEAHGFDGDDLALVVTELVTNAVRHGQPPVELEIETTDDSVTVVVADHSASRPVPRAAGPDAEGGRGLQLVDVLSAHSGVRPQPPGKAVWAELPRR